MAYASAVPAPPRRAWAGAIGGRRVSAMAATDDGATRRECPEHCGAQADMCPTVS